MCSWVTQYGAQRNRCPLEMEEGAGPHGTKTTSVELREIRAELCLYRFNNRVNR